MHRNDNYKKHIYVFILLTKRSSSTFWTYKM